MILNSTFLPTAQRTAKLLKVNLSVQYNLYCTERFTFNSMFSAELAATTPQYCIVGRSSCLKCTVLCYCHSDRVPLTFNLGKVSCSRAALSYNCSHVQVHRNHESNDNGTRYSSEEPDTWFERWPLLYPMLGVCSATTLIRVDKVTSSAHFCPSGPSPVVRPARQVIAFVNVTECQSTTFRTTLGSKGNWVHSASSAWRSQH